MQGSFDVGRIGRELDAEVLTGVVAFGPGEESDGVVDALRAIDDGVTIRGLDNGSVVVHFACPETMTANVRAIIFPEIQNPAGRLPMNRQSA